MKTSFLLIFSLALLLFFLFTNLNSGTAYGGIGDTTGSPLSTMTCSGGGCHGGANYGATVSISVLDNSGNSISSYVPGQTYTLEINIISSSGNPAGYGAQTVVLDTANQQAGSLDSVLSSNTRITIFDGRDYLEQYGLNNGTLRAVWTAPAQGTGLVKIYSSGVAVDGWGNMIDDEATAAVSISLTEVASSALTYLNSEMLSIFPNPANDGIFNVKLNGKSGDYELEIRDLLGKNIMSRKVNIESGISELICLPENTARGFYMISIRNRTEKFNTVLKY
jgi:hypothetical protein